MAFSKELGSRLRVSGDRLLAAAYGEEFGVHQNSAYHHVHGVTHGQSTGASVLIWPDNVWVHEGNADDGGEWRGRACV